MRLANVFFFCEIFLKPEAGANQFDIDGRLVEYAIYTIYINVYICWSIRAAAAQGVLRVLSLSLSLTGLIDLSLWHDPV